MKVRNKVGRDDAGCTNVGLDSKKEPQSEIISEEILKMYEKSIRMGYKENPDIDIGI